MMMMAWLCKETGDHASSMRPSYAQMAVRGKERFQDSNGGEMSTTSADNCSVTDVCLDTASDLLQNKLSVRGGVVDKLKKTSQWHSVASRRLSADCAASENNRLPSSLVWPTERHSTVWYYHELTTVVAQLLYLFKWPRNKIVLVSSKYWLWNILMVCSLLQYLHLLIFINFYLGIYCLKCEIFCLNHLTDSSLEKNIPHF